MVTPFTYLPDHGVWIAIKALGKTMPVVVAICAAAQGLARIRWIVAFVAILAMALIPYPGMQTLWTRLNMIWFPLMLTGPEVPVALAICATAKGAARFFWIFGIWPVAALSTLSDFRAERWLSFESWLITTAAGLVLVKLSKRPAQVDPLVFGSPAASDVTPPKLAHGALLSHRAIESLRFVTAWICLAIFFALMVPRSRGPRDGFSLFVGISSLLATAWCLSLRKAGAFTAIVLVLLLLFGLWIVSLSPYGFLMIRGRGV